MTGLTLLGVSSYFFPNASSGGGGGFSSAAIIQSTNLIFTPATSASGTVNITSNATGFYWTGTFYHSTPGLQVTALTLNGAAPSQLFQVSTAAGDQTCTYGAAWYNPPTGAQTVAITYPQVPIEGPTNIFTMTNNGNTSAWRSAVGANETDTDPCSTTSPTAVNDIIIVHDQRFNSGGGTPPTTTAPGFISYETNSDNNEGARASWIQATSATQAIVAQDVRYSTLLAISIPPG